MKRLTAFLALLTCVALPAFTCSEFLCSPGELPGGKTALVSGRTLDFPLVEYCGLKADVVPRNMTWTSSVTMKFGALNIDIGPGKTWKNKYAFVGMSYADYVWKFIGTKNRSFYLDGMNEHGLSAAFLYLEETSYPQEDLKDPDAIFYLDLVAYLLGNCRNLEDVMNELHSVKVTGQPSLFNLLLPLHLIVHDADGHSVVVEWLADKANDGKPVMQIYDRSLVEKYQILTNDPNYLMQLQNLENSGFRKLNPENALEGLPGGNDFKSRFVRASALRFFSRPKADADSHVMQAFHILNRVDVMRGEAREWESPAWFKFAVNVVKAFLPEGLLAQFLEDTKTVYDITGTSVVRDHKLKRYYFNGFYNQNVKMIDLAAIDWDRESLDIESIPMDLPPAWSGRYELNRDITPMYRMVKSDINDSGLLDLSLFLKPDKDYLGKKGEAYVWAELPAKGGEVRYWKDGSWRAAKADGSIEPCLVSDALGNATVGKIFSGFDLNAEENKDWIRARIHIGYGASFADMTLKARSFDVYEVQSVPILRDKTETGAQS